MRNLKETKMIWNFHKSCKDSVYSNNIDKIFHYMRANKQPPSWTNVSREKSNNCSTWINISFDSWTIDDLRFRFNKSPTSTMSQCSVKEKSSYTEWLLESIASSITGDLRFRFSQWSINPLSPVFICLWKKSFTITKPKSKSSQRSTQSLKWVSSIKNQVFWEIVKHSAMKNVNDWWFNSIPISTRCRSQLQHTFS